MPLQATGKEGQTALMDAILQHDSATGHDKNLDNAWRGAEAYHFFMLCHQQLYSTNIDATVITAMRCSCFVFGRGAVTYLFGC